MELKDMSQDDWWKTLFDQKYLDTYLADLTPELTTQQVDFVIRAANLKPADRILDLACGHGRHSIELAKRGFNIVGLDYSELFIAKAKADANEAGVEVEFLQGDMRNLPFNESFDVVLQLFTSFGFFDDGTNQKVLEEINRSLKPGGRFLIDVVSGEAVMQRFNKEGVKDQASNLLKITKTTKMGDRTVDEIEEYNPEEQLIHTHREYMTDGEKKEYDFYLRVYTVPQYKDMLAKAGFEFRQLWGDFQGNPHDTNGNFRTIILATKK